MSSSNLSIVCNHKHAIVAAMKIPIMGLINSETMSNITVNTIVNIMKFFIKSPLS